MVVYTLWKFLEKEVKRYNEEFIEQNRAYGELGHPDGPTVNLDKVSHMVTSLQPDGKNFIGEAKVMSTPMGNIVKNIMEDGGKLAVSSRGMGSLTKKMVQTMSMTISTLRLQLILLQTLPLQVPL